jgi:hypothetical protein
MSKGKSSVLAPRSNFARVPSRVIDIDLSPHALKIYIYLLCQAEEFNPSIRLIAKRTHMSKNTVKKYLDEMIERRVISRGPGEKMQDEANEKSTYVLNNEGFWNDGGQAAARHGSNGDPTGGSNGEKRGVTVWDNTTMNTTTKRITTVSNDKSNLLEMVDK